MADEDESSKTEEASEHKLQEARKEGDVPISQEVKTWFTLFACLLVAWGIIPIIMERMVQFGKRTVNNSFDIDITIENIQKIFGEVCVEILIMIAAPLFIFFIVSIVSSMSQVGFLYAPKRMEIKWERLNFVQNFFEMFSKKRLVENLKGILKILAVLGGFYLALKSKYPTIVKLTGIDMYAGLKVLNDIILLIIFTVVIVMLVFAIADYFIQKFSYLRKHMMSKQEQKDEYKNLEGDPLIKSKIRALRLQKYRQNMMKTVPLADAVITNPTHYAVAIKYDKQLMPIPTVVAKGVDFLAARIKEIAKEHDVPIIEDPPLARALYASVDIDKEIPKEFYQPIIDVLRYVSKITGKKFF